MKPRLLRTSRIILSGKDLMKLNTSQVDHKDRAFNNNIPQLNSFTEQRRQDKSSANELSSADCVIMTNALLTLGIIIFKQLTEVRKSN